MCNSGWNVHVYCFGVNANVCRMFCKYWNNAKIYPCQCLYFYILHFLPCWDETQVFLSSWLLIFKVWCWLTWGDVLKTCKVKEYEHECRRSEGPTCKHQNSYKGCHCFVLTDLWVPESTEAGFIYIEPTHNRQYFMEIYSNTIGRDQNV